MGCSPGTIAVPVETTVWQQSEYIRMKVIFDHRQKTGGTSLRTFLAAALGADRVSPQLLEGSIVLAAHLLDRFDVVCGHLDLPPEYDFPSDVYHVALLRDPIDRFLSHVSYLREVDDHDRLSDYLRRTELAQIIADGRARLNTRFWNAYAYHFARGERDMTGAALRVLSERFQLVGITEEFPQTIALLCSDLGLPADLPIPYERATAWRVRQAELEPGQIARLRDLMAADFHIYRQALARFRERAAALRGAAGSADRTAPPAAQPVAPPPPPAEPTVALLRRAEAYGTQSVSSWPQRGEEIDIGCEVEAVVDLSRVDFRVRIYNDLEILLYEEFFTGIGDGLRAGAACEFGITLPLLLGLGFHFVDLVLHVEQADGCSDVVEFHRACDFVVERAPGITSTGLVALPAKPYLRRAAADEMAGYEARLSVLHQPHRLPAGGAAAVQLALLNSGGQPLEIFGIHRVTLGYHLRDARTGETLPQEMPRSSLGADIASGGRTLVEATLTAPEVPGSYVVEWDLVREWVAWFGLECPAPLEVVAE
jgi:hypothetical protein